MLVVLFVVVVLCDGLSVLLYVLNSGVDGFGTRQQVRGLSKRVCLLIAVNPLT